MTHRMFVAVCGNVQDGFCVRGPYYDAAEAVDDNSGPDVCVLGMQPASVTEDRTPSYGQREQDRAAFHAGIFQAINLELFSYTEIAQQLARARGSRHPHVQAIHGGTSA